MGWSRENYTGEDVVENSQKNARYGTLGVTWPKGKGLGPLVCHTKKYMSVHRRFSVQIQFWTNL